MVFTRTGSRGFFLIELLVVIATTSVLFALLLPAVKSVRDAAAAQAALELVGDKSYVTAALCTPPICNSLDGNFQAVHLLYPEVPPDIRLGDVLTSGLRVSYDSTKLDTQPFDLHPWDDANIHDPGIVTLELLALSLTETNYAVDAVDWLDGEVDFVVRQPEGGQAWRLRALIAVAPDTPLSVHVVDEPAAVPEPTSLPLVAAALMGLAGSRRWSAFTRSAQKGTRDHRPSRIATAHRTRLLVHCVPTPQAKVFDGLPIGPRRGSPA
jgi:hypothetical protein